MWNGCWAICEQKPPCRLPRKSMQNPGSYLREMHITATSEIIQVFLMWMIRRKLIPATAQNSWEGMAHTKIRKQWVNPNSPARQVQATMPAASCSLLWILPIQKSGYWFSAWEQVKTSTAHWKPPGKQKARLGHTGPWNKPGNFGQKRFLLFGSTRRTRL